MRKTLLIITTLLSACASASGTSTQSDRLARVASNTLDAIHAKAGVSVKAPRSDSFVLSPNSRFARINSDGIILDTSDGSLLIPPSVAYNTLKENADPLVSVESLASLLDGSYLRVSPNSKFSTGIIADIAAVVLPTMEILSDKKCLKHVDVLSSGRSEVFRVMFAPDCVMDVLDAPTSDFLSFVSEDFTVTAVSGVVSSFGPTGAQQVSFLGFYEAVDPSWDGSSVSLEDLKFRPPGR